MWTDEQIEEVMRDMAERHLALEEKGQLSWVRALSWRIRMVRLALQHSAAVYLLRSIHRDTTAYIWLIPCNVHPDVNCSGCPMFWSGTTCNISMGHEDYPQLLLQQLKEARRAVGLRPEEYSTPAKGYD
jgi:hypothetical protein